MLLVCLAVPSSVLAVEVTAGFFYPTYIEGPPEIVETAYGPADTTEPLEVPTEWHTVSAGGYPPGGTCSFGKRSGPGDIIWHDEDDGVFAARTVGTYTFSVTYHHDEGSASARSGNFVIFTGDLAAQGVDDEDEEDPGAFVGLAEEEFPRKRITLQVQGLSEGKMRLTVAGNEVEVWTAAEGGEMLWPNDHMPWEPDPLEFDAGTRSLYVEGVDLSSGPRDVRLDLKAGVEESGEWREWTLDTVKFTVARVNLAAQGLDEDHEEDPGGFWRVNDNDSDGDGTIDADDGEVLAGQGGDPDLLALTLYGVSPNGLPETDTVELTWSGGSVQVFENRDKSSPISSGAEYQLSELPKDVYVEADAASGGLGDVGFTLEYTKEGETFDDVVKLTMMQADVDLDGTDEGIDELDPGAFIALNDDDDDRDGVIDFDDGYDKDGIPGNADDENVDEDDLVELTVRSVLPSALTGPVTLSKSDPNDRIRLWTSAVKGEGNEVSLPAGYQTPAELPETLYVEGVLRSQAEKDVSLQVAYSHEGIQHVDVTKLSVVQVNMSCQGLNEEHEEDPGGFVMRNDDDDDGDGIGDYEDGYDKDGVPGNADDGNEFENDLVQLTLRSLKPSSLTGTVTLNLTDPGGAVKLWVPSEGIPPRPKGTQLSGFPIQYTAPGDLPETLWVEGIDQSAAVNDVELKLSYTKEGKTFEDIINLTVAAVESVHWEAIEDVTVLDDNPNAGLGAAIFPGGLAPDDEVDHARVQVKARMNPPLANRAIHFIAFDVDDPSADAAPVDGEQGPDNRGAPQAGTLATDSAATDANGYAAVTFSVTKNPGDNFRVVACLAGANSSNLAAKQDDGENARVLDAEERTVAHESGAHSMKASPLLTVWRRLHVEFDTMEEAGGDEPFGTVTGTTELVRPTTLTAVTSSWRVDSLSGGVLNPDGDSADIAVDPVNDISWKMALNSAGQSAVYRVQTEYRYDTFDNDGQNGVDDAGEVFEMTPWSGSPRAFAVNTDDPSWLTNLDPPTESETIEAIDSYFHEAYIDCTQITEGNDHAEFGWLRNGYAEHANIVDTERSPDYWTVAVAWCYDCMTVDAVLCATHSRYTMRGDDDPEREGVPAGPGNRSSILGVVNGIGVLGSSTDIYCETIRDRFPDNFPTDYKAQIANTVAHELGHLLGLRHAMYDGSFDADDAGIMGWQPYPEEPPYYGLCTHDFVALSPWSHEEARFSNNNLADLRNASDPWQE